MSTFDEQCGIAGYTRSLLEQLDGALHIKVFDLDQSMMRATDGNLLKAADGQIREFCAAFADYDVVNLQLEYGTLGALQDDIVRRFRMILDAAPALSVTFHTILPAVQFPADRLREKFFRFELWNTYATLRDWRRAKRYRDAIYDSLRAFQKEKPLGIIVHTPRDAKHMKLAEGFRDVRDHPLAFLRPDRIADLKASKEPTPLSLLPKGPKDRIIVGVFGFVSAYKGIQTAIKAIQLCPDQYELAIFGGLHPGEIRPGEYGGPSNVHPYIDSLLRDLGVQQSHEDDGQKANASKTVVPRGQQVPPLRPLHERVHFMGVQDDDGLAAAMHAVDVVVLPYFETGQASSGPMSIAIEMGARVVASRTQGFMQFARYVPDRISFFDAGNYLELAQRVQTAVGEPRLEHAPAYTAETNRALYVELHKGLSEQADRSHD